MATKRINDLTIAADWTAGDKLAIDGATTRSIEIENLLGANVVAIRDLTGEADKLQYFTGTDTVELTDFTAAGRALLDDADAAAQRATLGVAIGTDVQAFSDLLEDIAGISFSEGDILYHDGSNLVRLARGANGTFLKSTATVPTWDILTGGGNMLSTNNLSDVDDAVTSRENLGLVGIFRPEDPAYGGGPGVADNAAAFQALATAVRAAGGGIIELQPNETYTVYASDPATGFYNLFDLSDTTGVIFNGNGATISCPSTDFDNSGDITITAFYLENTHNYQIHNVKLDQPNYQNTHITRGFIGISNLDHCTNGLVTNFSMRGGRAAFWNVRSDLLAIASFARGLTILNCYLEKVYYGITAQKNMHGITARGVTTRGCVRSYYGYNVSNHDIQIDSDANSGTGQDILIVSNYISTESSIQYNTTSNIKVDYFCRPQAGWTGPHAFTCIDFVHGSGAEGKQIIRDIDIHVNIDNQVTGDPIPVLRVLNQATPGQNRQLSNVRVSGSYWVSASSTGNWMEIAVDKNWTGDSISNFLVEDFTINSANSNMTLAVDGRAIVGPLTFRNISGNDGANKLFSGTNMTLANVWINVENCYWVKGLRTSNGGLARAATFSGQYNIPAAGHGIGFIGNATSGTYNPFDFATSASIHCGGIVVDQGAATTAVATSSDVRGKPNRDLLSAEAAIDVINGLRIWDFDKDGNVIRGVGVLAQEAQKVLPRMVFKGDDDMSLKPGDEGYEGWAVEKAGPVPYLVVAVQTLLSELQRVTAELAALSEERRS